MMEARTLGSSRRSISRLIASLRRATSRGCVSRMSVADVSGVEGNSHAAEDTAASA